MHVLIIGYGSIGKRHAETINHLGGRVSLVSSQGVTQFTCYPTILSAIENETFDYTVVANPTHVHHATLVQLSQLNYRGKVLVEKPLFSQVELLPHAATENIVVAYNLRFNELLLAAKQCIENQKLVSITAHVGQYLPMWRKTGDYRQCYSAKKECGGGALRDLSHELDYIHWFCGKVEWVTAQGGKHSNLEINSDDVYSILMQTNRCQMVNLHLNYLDRHTRREIVINTNTQTLSIDLINGTLKRDGEILINLPSAAQLTHVRQHAALIKDDITSFCSYSDGLYIVKLIAVIEKAATSKAWMYL